MEDTAVVAARLRTAANEAFAVEHDAHAGEAVYDSASLHQLAEFLERYPDSRTAVKIARALLGD